MKDSISYIDIKNKLLEKINDTKDVEETYQAVRTYHEFLSCLQIHAGLPRISDLDIKDAKMVKDEMSRQ